MPNTKTTMDEFAEDLSTEADDLLDSLRQEEDERLARTAHQHALVEIHEAIMPCTEGYFPDMFIPELSESGSSSWREHWSMDKYSSSLVRLAMLPASRAVRKLTVQIEGFDLGKLLSPSMTEGKVDPKTAYVARIFRGFVDSVPDESQLATIEKKLAEVLEMARSYLSHYHAYFDELVSRMKAVIDGSWLATAEISPKIEPRSDGRKLKTAIETVTSDFENIPELCTTDGKWLQSNKVAELQSPGTRALANYRCAGDKTTDGLVGVDYYGRVWRKSNSNAHAWYLRSSLKSEFNLAPKPSQKPSQ